MQKYDIYQTKHFERRYKKLVRKNPKVIKLMTDPFQKGLETHPANTVHFGKKWSSRVTGDLRIAWDFIEGEQAILVLTLGGHSGGDGVYV